MKLKNSTFAPPDLYVAYRLSCPLRLSRSSLAYIPGPVRDATSLDLYSSAISTMTSIPAYRTAIAEPCFVFIMSSVTNSVQGITWRLGFGIDNTEEPEGPYSRYLARGFFLSRFSRWGVISCANPTALTVLQNGKTTPQM